MVEVEDETVCLRHLAYIWHTRLRRPPPRQSPPRLDLKRTEPSEEGDKGREEDQSEDSVILV